MNSPMLPQRTHGQQHFVLADLRACFRDRISDFPGAHGTEEHNIVARARRNRHGELGEASGPVLGGLQLTGGLGFKLSSTAFEDFPICSGSANRFALGDPDDLPAVAILYRDFVPEVSGCARAQEE